MEVLELDSLYLSKRILVDSDDCKDFVSGGVLVSNIDGTIKRILTSQEEINSWMFRSTGSEVKIFSLLFLRVKKKFESEKLFTQNFLIRCMTLKTTL